MLKELQSLGLDVKVLNEEQQEIEIMETIDYGDNDLRRELENESRNYNYENESFESMGYQKQEFDDDAEELVSVEEDIELEEDFDESEFAESFDE